MIGTEAFILLLLFAAIAYICHTGFDLFSKGWSSYEEGYIQGAEKTLDAMYLTIPAQHLAYLSLTSFFIVTIFVSLLSGSWPFGLILGIVALLTPIFVLRGLKKRRDKLFGIQLVGGMSNMGNALKAGLSLPQAIDLIHQEMDNPIAQEFRLLSHELHFGTDMPTALGHLEERMPNPDLSLMITAINVSMEVGGNLSDIFENISDTIRERQTVEAKVKALTAQGKMQGTVMCMIPIGLCTALTVMYPDMMAPLYETTIGMILIGICIIMLICGWLLIAKLTKIDF
ncbi:MAG: type II secretion system F family protein [Planctomycetes bacterium]|nr:type II secretion system F family protein [Planctomycetota bacterium]